jgi:uroporphyrinogen-III decarboxylase
MHLCGNVQRHFPTLIKELNVRSFDTGYPIDFTTLRDDIGEGVEIQGGVKVSDLLMGTPESVSDLTRTILESGIMRGGKFIIKEANDLAPGVPLANMQAMYAAVKKYGIYS